MASNQVDPAAKSRELRPIARAKHRPTPLLRPWLLHLEFHGQGLQQRLGVLVPHLREEVLRGKQ